MKQFSIFCSFSFLHCLIRIASSESSCQSVSLSPHSDRALSHSFTKQSSAIKSSRPRKYDEQNFNVIATNRQRTFIRQQSVELKATTHSENQQFLKEIVTNILDGLGIGWLKIIRVKKLMEDENYRNFVLSRLNINLDKKYYNEDDHIEDVVSR